MKEQDKVITIVNTHSEAENLVKMLKKSNTMCQKSQF